MIVFKGTEANQVFIGEEKVYQIHYGGKEIFKTYLDVAPIVQWFASDISDGDETVTSNTDWEVSLKE